VGPTADRELKAPPGGRDWTVQTADAIESAVAAVRDKTAVPLTTVARVVVYGLLAAVLGVTVAVLLTIGLVRAVDVSIPGDVWSAYLTVGGIFTLAGALLLRKAAASSRQVRKEAVSRE